MERNFKGKEGALRKELGNGEKWKYKFRVGKEGRFKHGRKGGLKEGIKEKICCQETGRMYNLERGRKNFIVEHEGGWLRIRRKEEV